MKPISTVTFLAVLSTIARLTAGQDCPEGTHLTNGACCPVGTTFFTSPSGGHEACCADGTTYHHNTAGNAGTCCPAGYTYDEGTNDCYQRQVAGGSKGPVRPVQRPLVSAPEDRCAGCCDSPDGQGQTPGSLPGSTPGNPPDTPGNTQGKPAVVVPPVPGTGDNPGGGIATPGLPNQPRPNHPQSSLGSCGCATGTPCSTDDDLGLQYGHCYNLIDTNGLPLGRDTGGTYQSGGDVQNLIFRVCKSTDDCSGELGKHVPQHTGKFFLQDQQGWTNWRGPAWFGNNWPHMQVERPRNAAEFIGEGVCMYGSPAICLRDGAKERGLIAPCPLGWDSARAHIGYTNNPNTCKAYRFIPTGCMSNMVAEKN